MVDGIGNDKVRVGDKVILIPGMACPVVIRERLGSAKLVSPANGKEVPFWPDWKKIG